MIWGSVTARKIDLEEKRVYASNPVIQDSFFSLPAVAAPPVKATAMPAPVVAPPVATTDDYVDPVFQEPEENVATHEGEQQQPQIDEAPQAEPSGRP
jgi:hypothetical protein